MRTVHSDVASQANYDYQAQGDMSWYEESVQRKAHPVQQIETGKQWRLGPERYDAHTGLQVPSGHFPQPYHWWLRSYVQLVNYSD